MTQEGKQLLLQDLCARLPYEVRLHISSDLVNKDDTLLGISLTEGLTPYITHNKIISTHSGYLYSVEEVRPYLRPMSSMTEEERSNLRVYCRTQKGIIYDVGVSGAINSPAIIDFLNANHFDYRGLIPMGLALPAQEGMYDFKEK